MTFIYINIYIVGKVITSTIFRCSHPGARWFFEPIRHTSFRPGREDRHWPPLTPRCSTPTSSLLSISSGRGTCRNYRVQRRDSPEGAWLLPIQTSWSDSVSDWLYAGVHYRDEMRPLPLAFLNIRFWWRGKAFEIFDSIFPHW